MSKQTEDLKAFGVEAGIIDDEDARNISMAAKPTVILPGQTVSNSDTATNLYKLVAPTLTLFTRDGNVCEPQTKDGITALTILDSAAACTRFEDFATFLRYKKNRRGELILEPEQLNKSTTEILLKAYQKNVLPEIQGILRCPILTERNGKLHEVTFGYDSTTKLFVTENVPIFDVPLQDAVDTLSDLLQDYHFQTPGDRSRALASMITPALKFGGLIRGFIPADVAEADLSQSGKTYRQQINAALYNDTCAVVNKQEQSGVGNLDERFSTALVQGRPFIQFDNVRGKFSLQSLESFMTSHGKFGARPAYSSVIQIDPSKFMIQISSNGFQTTQDLANRSSIIRIFKRTGYSFKEWHRKGVFKGYMLEFVQDNQPYLLSCVFRIVREWFNLGRPRTSETGHSFREWAQVMDWIVQNIFKAAPLLEGHAEAQTRTSNPDLTFLRSLAIAVMDDNRLGAALKAGEIFDICGQAQLAIPSLAPDKRNDQDAGAKAIGKTMARLFDAGNEVRVDAYTVKREQRKQVSSVQNPFEVKVYTFTRQTTPP